MIEPRPGQIGEQHGLQRLTDTLEALRQGQTQQQQRDTAIQAQLAMVTQEQATLARRLARLAAWSQRLIGALALLTVLTLGLVAWQVAHPPTLEYARAWGVLDASLVQHWGSLSKPVQEQLTTTYSGLGLSSPGERQRRK